MLTDANFSGQRSSMQGQQRPLSFLERRQASQEFNPHLTYDGGGTFAQSSWPEG